MKTGIKYIEYCTSQFWTPLTAKIPFETEISQSIIPQTIAVFSEGIVQRDFIVVAWKEEDVSLFQRAALPNLNGTTLPNLNGTTLPNLNDTVLPTSNNAGLPSSNNTAQIGTKFNTKTITAISVSSVMFLLLLFVMGLFAIRSLKKRKRSKENQERKEQDQSAVDTETWEKSELEGKGKHFEELENSEIHELDGATYIEIDGTTPLQEVGSQSPNSADLIVRPLSKDDAIRDNTGNQFVGGDVQSIFIVGR
jgi:hypothetical protein